MKKIFTLVAGIVLAGSMVMSKDINLTQDDDFAEIVAEAEAGDVLILADGEYVLTADTKIEKAITIKAENAMGATVKGACFIIAANFGGDVTIKDIYFDGTRDDKMASYFTDFNGATIINNVLIDGCRIENYGNCLLRANRAEATCESYKVNNCTFKNFASASIYPFIQATKTKIKAVEITNSTITDMISEFFQIYGTAGGFDEGVVTFKNNTFYNVVTSDARTPFGGKSGTFNLENCILVKSPVHGTKELNFDKSVVRNAVNNVMYDFAAGALATGSWTSISGTIETDPGFKDADNGDFTLPVGSDLITNNIGDPRWFGDQGGTSIEASAKDKNIVSTVYFDLMGRQVTEDTKGIIVEKNIYDDGSVATSKTIK